MEKLNGRELWKDISLLLLGSLIYGIGTYVFVIPANIAPGGATGKTRPAQKSAQSDTSAECAAFSAGLVLPQ